MLSLASVFYCKCDFGGGGGKPYHMSDRIQKVQPARELPVDLVIVQVSGPFNFSPTPLLILSSPSLFQDHT